MKSKAENVVRTDSEAPESEEILNEFTKEDLVREYCDNGKTMKEVSEILGVAVGTVYNYMKRYGIEPRRGFTDAGRERIRKANSERVYPPRTLTDEQRKHISDGKRGKYKYKTKYGGHKKNHVAGYVMVYVPENHRATKDGYVMEHVLMAEEMLGRPLTEKECVHHINGKKDDNRFENLCVMTKSEHMSYHMKKRHEAARGEC